MTIFHKNEQVNVDSRRLDASFAVNPSGGLLPVRSRSGWRKHTHLSGVMADERHGDDRCRNGNWQNSRFRRRCWSKSSQRCVAAMKRHCRRRTKKKRLTTNEGQVQTSWIKLTLFRRFSDTDNVTQVRLAVNELTAKKLKTSFGRRICVGTVSPLCGCSDQTKSWSNTHTTKKKKRKKGQHTKFGIRSTAIFVRGAIVRSRAPRKV